MKIKISNFLLIIFCGITFHCFSQITINKADMPAAGNQFRISIENNLHGVTLSTTGPNTTWDFSQLIPSTQTVDTFFSILATQYIPITYNVVYNDPFDQAHQANVVTRSFNSMNPFPQIQISENFNFFKSSNSAYTQVGQGAKINGLPTAMTYDNAESFFKFPMTIGNTDSSVSKYGLNILTLGYYGETFRRVNLVDGYGSLTTPFGTYDVMRVKSLIYTKDTLFLDTLNFGIHLSKPLETQYIWLGDNQGDPLLMISKINNNTTARYKDSIPLTTNIYSTIINNKIFTLSPNPATNILKIVSEEKIDKVEFLNMIGDVVLSCENDFSAINVSNLRKGIYVIRIYCRSGITSRKFVKE